MVKRSAAVNISRRGFVYQIARVGGSTAACAVMDALGFFRSAAALAVAPELPPLLELALTY
jgi:hypothetical protein